MPRTWITPLITVGSILILLAGNALADPTEVAQYKDPRSGDLFELFQERDGSYFCSVQRKDGSLSGFEVEASQAPQETGERPDMESLAETYYREAPGKDSKALQKKEQSEQEEESIKNRQKSTDSTSWDQATTTNTENISRKYGGNQRHARYHQADPDRSAYRKTVPLLLLLVLSEPGTS